MVVDAWWFALLFAVPSVLDPTPVEFGMRSLAFSGNYWLACCAFAGVALTPRVAARIGGRAFAGRRGRFVRATCIALAAMWFCASLVLALSRCCGRVRDRRILPWDLEGDVNRIHDRLRRPHVSARRP